MKTNTDPAAPKILTALPLPVLAIRENARAVGVALAGLEIPRRQIPHLFQLRFDYWLDAGGEFRTYQGDIFAIHDDTMDRMFPDPSCKWLSEFPRRCTAGPLLQTPNTEIRKRLQLLELAMRTPPLGFAI